MRLLSLLITAMFFLTAMAFAESSPEYMSAVTAYRQGQTQEAYTKLTAITAAQPNHVEARYYLAMTQARLGQVDEARASYQEVCRLAPSSEAAKLSQLGLSYLPASTQALDAPPQIGQDVKSSEAKPAAMGLGGMDSQAMQMMMMMSAMGGGGKGGGNSMMMLPLLQQMTGGGQGEKIPPETMQLMMQQQMMPDMNSLFDSKNDN